ncbi:amidase [Leucobacter ruminantium]|uniref:Amidase n=1 Tax=Leucobacter ruminantium TaxID=1289170 RepID=A0A939LVP8_9MICO|nr:amidase [Leucobacter ruminantium]MBO1803803.1 amidase [Leucobacter ruminantium]
MTLDIAWNSAQEIARAIRAGEISPEEVAEATIARIEKYDPGLNVFSVFDPERIRAQARAISRRLAEGEDVGPLAGVPFAIKDMTAVKGDPQTAGLIALKDSVPDHNAALFDRLIDAGGIYVGKTTVPEAGYAVYGESHLFGATHNPWKPAHTAGGSSTGSAVAVASGLVPIAEGSDGAGSVRAPASLNGIVGFKPSLARIPCTVLPTRYETWAFHGPLTRTVADAALMFQVMAGPSEQDPMSLPDDGTDYLAEIEKDIAGLRIAYSPDLGTGYEIDPEVAEVCRRAVGKFEQLGATVVEATPPWARPEDAFWHSIWVPGFSAERDLIDWDAWEGQIDPELIDLIKEADTVAVSDYGRANLARAQMYETFVEFMRDYDVIVSPSLTHAAHPHGQFAPDHLLGQSVQRQLLGWLLTYPYNMLTVPAISMPAGFTEDGRPIGLQIAGRKLADAEVLRVAANFERVHSPWTDGARPDLAPFES